MRPNFLHSLHESFFKWFDNELLEQGRAFTNVSGTLYPIEDPNFPNKFIYSNPFGQWVYNSNIQGANIPNGVFIDGVYTPRGVNGLILDYNGGRALLNANASNVTASYAVRDFNLYSSTLTDAELLFSSKQFLRPKFTQAVKGISPKSEIAPLIYIKRDYYSNEPFALGGQDNSILQYKAVIIGTNDFEVDGVGGIFTDAARKSFMLLDGVQSATNRYGDFSNGSGYNYLDETVSNYNSSKLVYIADVDFYRFKPSTEISINKDFVCAYLDFTLEIPRYPRGNIHNSYPYDNTNYIVSENGDNLIQ